MQAWGGGIPKVPWLLCSVAWIVFYSPTPSWFPASSTGGQSLYTVSCLLDGRCFSSDGHSSAHFPHCCFHGPAPRRRQEWEEGHEQNLICIPERLGFFCVKVEPLTGYAIHSWRGYASRLNLAVFLTQRTWKMPLTKCPTERTRCLSSCPTCSHHFAQDMREKRKGGLSEFKWLSLQDDKEKLRSDIQGDILTAHHSKQICALLEILWMLASGTRMLQGCNKYDWYDLFIPKSVEMLWFQFCLGKEDHVVHFWVKGEAPLLKENNGQAWQISASSSNLQTCGPYGPSQTFFFGGGQTLKGLDTGFK